MIINCEECVMFETEQCQDCFVMALLSRPPGPVIIDAEEEQAITCLQEAGMTPSLKFKRKAG
ncbi:MAG: hypothetical protein ACRDJF_07010 [Actinomycetota bacterium]